MAVVPLGRLHVPVFEPLLQLSGLPIWFGASRARVAATASAQLGDRRPSSRAACDGAREQVAEDLLSIAGPATSDVPNGCRFSGESDGDVTSHPCFGSSTSVSRKNSAAPLSSG